MLTARLGSPRRAEMETGDRRVAGPTRSFVTTQPAARQDSDLERATHHRPRCHPLSRFLGRRNRDAPAVDTSTPGPAHGQGGRSPTIPARAAVAGGGGHHGYVQSIQMTTRRASDSPASHRPGAERRVEESSRDDADEEDGSGQSSKRFLLCFPRPKSRHVRAQALSCLITGTFSLTLLGVYVGLTQTNTIRQGELTILMALTILAGAALFIFSVVRLCLAVFRPDRENRRRTMPTAAMGLNRYLVPAKPIPVVLVRDEEAAGIESQAVNSRPPAYGLWRESVRVDPNRLFWQRTQSPAIPERRTGTRPPSYASDDGVAYVVEAQPRSLLPSHSSDVRP